MPPGYLSSLILIFSVSALWSPVLSQAQSHLPYWTKATPPTVARQELYPEVLNGKIYVVGGRKFAKDADGTTRQVNVPNLEVYDPKLDRWETR